MIFKILVLLHTLSATIWTGGHLILAIMVLPKALKKSEPELIENFEQNFETLGLISLVIQILTGLGLTWIYFPQFQGLWNLDNFLSRYIMFKLGILLLTLALAIHARFFIIPNLSKETLNQLAYHIVGVTTLAVLFVVFGVGIRLGGFV
ncbi:CopD family protein [Cyanobacterium aponinum UTEX 3222]|uniref:CopD family protein n=1 Tax=Cyanobacterium aponinum TaxID=379064 RepID=UPI002B4BB8C8|nr:CopD family protein [Cyanobacterium aponinum]WRL39857.1 CopD family protein [Cyanobacterium aponinum UTEX 3221]WRL42701.1 CopD family protein [Cyanobacterium aponinum UTEX 3222]